MSTLSTGRLEVPVNDTVSARSFSPLRRVPAVFDSSDQTIIPRSAHAIMWTHKLIKKLQKVRVLRIRDIIRICRTVAEATPKKQLRNPAPMNRTESSLLSNNSMRFHCQNQTRAGSGSIDYDEFEKEMAVDVDFMDYFSCTIKSDQKERFHFHLRQKRREELRTKLFEGGIHRANKGKCMPLLMHTFPGFERSIK